MLVVMQIIMGNHIRSLLLMTEVMVHNSVKHLVWFFIMYLEKFAFVL